MPIIGGEWPIFLNKVAGNSIAYNGEAEIEYIGDSGEIYFDGMAGVKICRDAHGISVEIWGNIPSFLYSGLHSKFQDFEFNGRTLVITKVGTKVPEKENGFKVNISIV